MKKAFAVMTTMLVALACFGFLTKAEVSASESKIFTEDPTLAEDEIPMYIMDSIYSTFPNYYDNEELPDEKWQGASRMYPWNETKLRIAQYVDGVATGKYYAVYFTGSLTHMSGNDQVPGAGKNILVYNVDSEGVRLDRIDQGTVYPNRNASDPSLSHMVTNVSGQDLKFNMQEVFKRVKDGADDGRMYLASLVFDAQGRAIRGSTGNAAFLEPGTEGAAETLVAPLFCYVDGKLVKYVEGETTPDKKMEAKLDPETGEVVLDDEGNPVMEQTDKDHFLYKRFTWAWFEAKPENVNEVGFLEEGWDKDSWDYCWEQDGGYMCIAFMGTDGSEEILDADMLAAYNRDQKAAQGDAYVEAAAGTVSRNVILEFFVPAGGYTYDLGYLDRGTALYPIYRQIFLNSFLYGRSANYSEQKTVNFSSSGLIAQDYIDGETGLRLLENNVIEVMPGTVVNPGKNVVYTGLTRYWDKGENDDINDVTSFVSSDATCEFYIKVNGTTYVMPAKYASWEALVADFMADINAFCRAKAEAAGNAYTDVVLPETIATSDPFYTTFNNELGASSASYASFLQDAAMWAKWSFVFEYIDMKSGGALLNDNKSVASPGNWTYTVWGFLTKSPEKTGWPAIKADSTTADTDLLDVVKWSDYTFTASENLDEAYEVEYTVKNVKTNNESTITITYVVTDVYTPIIEVNKAGLNISNELVNGALVINGGQPITAAQLLTAYNGKYTNLTGVGKQDIKGRDITYRVTLESDTLDFNNPKEGTHKVTARVANSATKQAVAQFEVVIKDRTAPEVEVVSETIVVPYASTFDLTAGIISAYDNVDGNLKQAAFMWAVDISATPVNTNKPGNYTVTVGVYDKAGNHKDVSYKVVVSPAYAKAEDLKDLEDMVEENGISISESQESLAALQAVVAEIQSSVSSVLAKVEEVFAKVSEGGCGSSAGALAVSMLSAASLLVLVLRKKH